jgi:hypothetical protein
MSPGRRADHIPRGEAGNKAGSNPPISLDCAPHEREQHSFSILETRVIAIGLLRGEPPAILTGRPPGLLRRMAYHAFGHPLPRALANTRLEALRAMTAAIRRNPDRPDPRIVATFVDAGWHPAHAARIRDMAIAARYPDDPSARRVSEGTDSREGMPVEHLQTEPSGIPRHAAPSRKVRRTMTIGFAGLSAVIGETAMVDVLDHGAKPPAFPVRPAVVRALHGGR